MACQSFVLLFDSWKEISSLLFRTMFKEENQQTNKVLKEGWVGEDENLKWNSVWFWG